MMVLSSAINRTERHREMVMMTSLAPEGYSGSSDSLSRAAASWIGLVSITFSDGSRSLFATECLEEERSDDGFSSRVDGGMTAETGDSYIVREAVRRIDVQDSEE